MVEVWSLKSSSEVLLEEIDEFLACYSVLTGKTHILNAFPAEIVKLLAAAPKTSGEVVEYLAVSMGEESGEWASSIDPLLNELRDLQLLVARPL